MSELAALLIVFVLGGLVGVIGGSYATALHFKGCCACAAAMRKLWTAVHRNGAGCSEEHGNHLQERTSKAP